MPSRPPLRSLALLCVALCPLLLAAGPEAARAAPDATTRDFDQLHLDLRLEPDLEACTIQGRATLAFEALVEGLAKLRLHAEGLQILAVVSEDLAPLAWRHEKDTLIVDLATPLARGQGSEVAIAYRARPTRGLYFHRPTSATPHVPRLCYSQGQSNDTRRWVPCYDLPDDRLAWDVRITVPESLTTLSNGVRISQTEEDDGRRTDHWRFEDPSPSYLLSIVVGDLDLEESTWGEVGLTYAAPRGHGAHLEASLGRTPDMLAYFSSWTGQPYPWPRYTQVFVWDFVYGGMENVTATTLNMRALHDHRSAPQRSADSLVAHELAHMWFGDLVTCRTWNDIWLNEGFATYMTDLWFGHAHGRQEFLLRRRSQNRAYMDGSPAPHDLGLTRNPRGDVPLELSGGKAYNRGAAILHMLRLEIGDDAFQGAVRAWLARYRHRSATTEDFRRVVEHAAGRDLRFFFDQWVYGAGYPVLDVRRDGRRLTIRQVQPRKGGQGLFRFTLPVRIDADTEVVPVRIWKEQHVVELPQITTSNEDYVRVGVGGDLLARIRVHQGLHAWKTMRLEDPDVTARLDAVEALEAHGEAAVEALAAPDPAWAVRRAAAEALGRFDTSTAALAALRRLAVDPDPRVREAVATALGARSRAEVGGLVLVALTAEPHPVARAAFARAAGRLKAEGALEALRALLAEERPAYVLRSGVMAGLAALGDVRGAALARPYTAYAWGGGGDQRLRKSALDCVLALAPDAVETRRLLVSLLDDPHASMRQWAAEGCGRFRVAAAKARLERMAKHDARGGPRRAAAAALKRL